MATITEEKQNEIIDCMVDYLPILRDKTGISQEALSKLIGISRQTYVGIESGKKRMSWKTCLALLFFFSYNSRTSNFIVEKNIFTNELIDIINLK